MGRKGKRIKILYTIPNFDTAGSGRVLYDLVKGLDPNKFDISIACRHNRGSFFKEIDSLGLPIHFINTTVSLRPYLSLIFRVKPFRSFVKSHKFDIVHSWHWSSDWSEVLATRMANSKFIYTKKAMSWGNIHWRIRSYLSNFIITINSEMQSFFPNKKQQKLIPLGIDTDEFSPEHFNIKREHKFKIITIANLVPVKGVEVLIKSITKLTVEDIVLDIVGGGDEVYIAELKQLVSKLKLDSRVRFLGNQTDVRPFLAGAELYVIPTLNEGRKEGMPMALVEAMSMQTMVLGSNISGINYVLKDFQDLLFPANDSEVLSHKILELYNKTEMERNALAMELRRYCVANFSMEAFIYAHEKLYQQMVTY